MTCINIKNPEFTPLVNLVGEDKAYIYITKNNGNPLSVTKTGEPSEFYNKIKTSFGEQAALEYKINAIDNNLFEEYGGQVDKNGEPNISFAEKIEEVDAVLSQKKHWTEITESIVRSEDKDFMFNNISASEYYTFVEDMANYISGLYNTEQEITPSKAFSTTKDLLSSVHSAEEDGLFKSKLDELLTNWSAVQKSIEPILEKRYGLHVKKNRKSQDEDNASLEEEVDGEEGTSRESYDDSSFEMDPLDSSSFRFKLILGNVPLFLNTEEGYKVEKTWINAERRNDPANLYYKILEELSGKERSTSEIQEYFKSHQDKNISYIHGLIEKSKTPYQVWNETTKLLNKASLFFKYAFVTRNEVEIAPGITNSFFTAKMLDSNRNDKSNMVYELAEEKFISEMFSNVDGVKTYNKEKANQIISDWRDSVKFISDFLDTYNKTKVKTQDDFKDYEFATSSFNSIVSDLLNKIGFTVSDADVKSYINNHKRYTGSEFSYKRSSELDKIFASLNDDSLVNQKQDNEVSEYNTRTIFNIHPEYIKRLSNAIADNRDSIIPKSFYNIDGNQIFAFTSNFHLTLEHQRLKNGESPILGADISYLNGSLYRENINDVKMFFIDGFKTEDSKSGLSNSTPEELKMLAIAGLANSGRDEILLLNPIHSDKPKLSVTQFVRYFKDGILSVKQDGSFNIKEAVVDEYMKIFNAEYDRILSSYNPDNNIQTEYDAAKKIFYLMPVFNYPVLKENVGTLIEKEDFEFLYDENGVFHNATDTLRTNRIIKDIIKKMIYSHIEAEVSSFEDLGIISTVEAEGKFKITEAKLDSAYKKSIQNFDGENLTKNALDFIGQFAVYNFINQANFQMLYGGDIALHATKLNAIKKAYKSKKAMLSFVDTTMNEATKRSAKDIAPRDTPGTYIYNPKTNVFEEDRKTYNALIVNDLSVITDSEYIKSKPQLKEAFESGKLTDAQEFRTPIETLDFMFKEGRIPDDMYKTLKTKALAQFGKKIDEISKDDLYSDAELKELYKISEGFKPVKPVYVGTNIREDKNVAEKIYIKSSYFGLFPQQFHGTLYDDIRIFMEKNNVDSLVFGTAAKLHLGQKYDLFIPGTRDLNIAGDPYSYIMQLERSNLGVQQEIPEHDTIPMISQINYNIFTDLNPNDFEGNSGFSFNNGKTKYTLQEFKRLKEEVKKQMFKNAFDQLTNKITNENGVLDVNKLAEDIKADLIDKGLDMFIPFINVVDNQFEIPLDYISIAEKLEADLISKFKKVVVQQTSGFSMPQGCSVGIKSMGDKSISSLKQGIIPTKGNKNKEKLGFLDIRDNKAKFAEIILPWMFKDKSGNVVNMNKHIDENGELNIPEEILETITARIPNNGRVSDMPVKIVGFFKPGFSNLVLVPEEIVSQMGSDFDVDKLYGYMKNYTVEDGLMKYNASHLTNDGSPKDIGTLTEEELQNLYLDILINTLKHPEVFKTCINLLDMNDLKNEADNKKESKLFDEYYTPITFDNMIERFINNRSGKGGVGIAANMLKLNSVLQGKDVKIESPIFVQEEQDENGVSKVLKLDDLSGIGGSEYNGEKRTKFQNHTIYMNEAVDNAKNVNLGVLGINETNMSIIQTLMQLNDSSGKSVGCEYSARIITQDIIRDLYNEINKRGNPLNIVLGTGKKLSKDDKESIVGQLYNKYNMMIKDNDSKLSFAKLRPLIPAPSVLERLMSDEDFKQTDDYAKYQLRILKAYVMLEDLNKELTSFVITLGTNPGKNLATVKAKKSIYEKYLDHKIETKHNVINGLNKAFINDDGSLTEFGTQSDILYKRSLDLLSDLYSYDEEFVKYATDMLLLINKDSSISAKDYKDIISNSKSYIYAQDESGLFNNLNKEKKEVNKIFHQLIELKNSDYKSVSESLLIKNLIIEATSKKNFEDKTIKYSSPVSKPYEDSEMKRDVLKLLSNPKTKDFAVNLIKYCFVTGGHSSLQRIIRSFPKSVWTKSGLSEFLRSHKEFLNNNQRDFFLQYIQNNPRKAMGISKALSLVINKEKLSTVVSLKSIDNWTKEAQAAGDNNKVKQLVLARNEAERLIDSTSPFIRIRAGREQLLFAVKHDKSNGSVLLTKIPVLEGKSHKIRNYVVAGASLEVVQGETEVVNTEDTNKDTAPEDSQETVENYDMEDELLEIPEYLNDMNALANGESIEDIEEKDDNIVGSSKLDKSNFKMSIDDSTLKLALSIENTGNLNNIEKFFNKHKSELNSFEKREFEQIINYINNTTLLDGLTFRQISEDKLGNNQAQYNRSTHTIEFGKTMSTVTFIHEVNHAMDNVFVNFYNANKNKTNLTESQQDIVNRFKEIDDLRSEVINMAIKDEDLRKSYFVNLIASNMTSQIPARQRIVYKEEIEGLQQELKDKYESGKPFSFNYEESYGLVSLSEFLNETKSNPLFRDYLGSIEIEGNILDRIIEAIRRAYKSILDTIGYNVDNTVLEKSYLKSQQLSDDILNGKFDKVLANESYLRQESLKDKEEKSSKESDIFALMNNKEQSKRRKKYCK